MSFATAAALVGGFAWVVGGRLLSIGAWTVLTIHAWVGLALGPLVVVRLAPRRWRLLVPSVGTAKHARAAPHPARRRLPAGGFYGEPTPAIDPLAWRLRVHGRVAREVSLSIDEGPD